MSELDLYMFVQCFNGVHIHNYVHETRCVHNLHDLNVFTPKNAISKHFMCHANKKFSCFNLEQHNSRNNIIPTR